MNTLKYDCFSKILEVIKYSFFKILEQEYIKREALLKLIS